MFLKLLFFLFLSFIGVTLSNQTHMRRQKYTTGDFSSKYDSQNISRVTINTSSKVNIKLYYETLCPASVRFFIRQLKPVMEKLAAYVNVDLVPYGNARTMKVQGHYKFRCQHGPAECYGNMLHACAIDAIENNSQAVLFNICLMQYSPYRNNNGFDYISVLNWCGYKLNLFINGVWECINSSRGAILLKNYGQETHLVKPRYVPYLLLNGSSKNEEVAQNNLISTVCQMLRPSPPPCYS